MWPVGICGGLRFEAPTCRNGGSLAGTPRGGLNDLDMAGREILVPRPQCVVQFHTTLHTRPCCLFSASHPFFYFLELLFSVLTGLAILLKHAQNSGLASHKPQRLQCM